MTKSEGNPKNEYRKVQTGTSSFLQECVAKLYQKFTEFDRFAASYLPVEHLLEVFVAGKMPCGSGETNLPDFAADLGSEPGCLGQKLEHGDVGQVAFGQLGFDAAQVAADLSE